MPKVIRLLELALQLNREEGSRGDIGRGVEGGAGAREGECRVHKSFKHVNTSCSS
jgi:hypothetical protein